MAPNHNEWRRSPIVKSALVSDAPPTWRTAGEDEISYYGGYVVAETVSPYHAAMMSYYDPEHVLLMEQFIQASAQLFDNEATHDTLSAYSEAADDLANYRSTKTSQYIDYLSTGFTEAMKKSESGTFTEIEPDLDTTL